jgi:hypothetical protein
MSEIGAHLDRQRGDFDFAFHAVRANFGDVCHRAAPDRECGEDEQRCRTNLCL